LQSLLLFGILIGTLVLGNVLYYFSGFFKKLGSTDIEEMNASEMSVTDEGILEENFPDEDEIVTEGEAKTFNIIGSISFLLVGCALWIYMGLTAGQIAYLLGPSDLMKLLVYFLLYLFTLRFSFGMTNKTIERSYEVKVMPEKLAFAIVMIVSYIIGINYHEVLPTVFKWHLFLFQ